MSNHWLRRMPCAWSDNCTDEAEALSTFEARLHKAPNASIGMIHKVFSAFEDDEEFRLIIFAINPLYVETYDANAGLEKVRDTVFRAETHSEYPSKTAGVATC